jgi:hypothetical protein
MTSIRVGDTVKLTSRYARCLMKRTRSGNNLDWCSRRGIARVINRSTIYIDWPERKTLDPQPHAAVEKAIGAILPQRPIANTKALR